MDINSLLSPQDSPANGTPPPSQPSSSRPSPSKRSSSFRLQHHDNQHHHQHQHLQHQQHQHHHANLHQLPPHHLHQAAAATPPLPHQLPHQQHHLHLAQPLPQSQHHLPSRPSFSHPQQQITSSPQHTQEHYPPQAHQQQQHVYHAHHHLAASTPLSSPSLATYQNGRAIHSATNTPPLESKHSFGPGQDARLTPHRSASTPGMDTLADLASMQQQQQAARQNAGGLRDPQVYHAQRPSISLQNIPRTMSGGSTADATMADSPTRPRDFVSASLDQENLDELKKLDQALKENPFDYQAHQSFITILHQGLANHLNVHAKDGHSYELLPELHAAYIAMDKIYPLGETLAEYWILDKWALARNLEERIDLQEHCTTTALKDEPKSVRLWVLYGEFQSKMYECANGADAADVWSEEEQSIARDIFTWDVLIDTWEKGAEATMHNIKDSHLVWDRYCQLLQEDLQKEYSADKLQRLTTLFEHRLNQPHANWDGTFGLYSTFISQYHINQYEEIMEDTKKRTADAKKKYDRRFQFEFDVDKAAQADNGVSEKWAFKKYIDWERKSAGPLSHHMVSALYDRALLRFPADNELWQDYVEFLISVNYGSLEVVERATRHCPWVGALWEHRLLGLETSNRDFKEIEGVKHDATKSGMLEYGGLEELLKVQQAWCGYLRRKAFDNPNATDEDIDIAEVGIRSAQDDVKETGLRKYGDAYHGDPQYRLERIHIKFLTQNGHIEAARGIWESLIPQQQDLCEFWYRYYIWEMVAWSAHAVGDRNSPGGRFKAPSKATDVLELALKRVGTLDDPERLVQMYQNHCEQHESVSRLRTALIEARTAIALVQYRRTTEYENTRQEATTTGAKRRMSEASSRADETEVGTKKVRHEERASRASTEAAEVKRDREHCTIIVKQLPPGTTQLQIRKFFSDCGGVKAVLVKPEGESTTATVEFNTFEDAHYALSKEAKGYEGKPIEILLGKETSLFVSNYPADWDEMRLRELFSPFGEVVEIRFPSLIYNARRNFCYVQYLSAESAQAASEGLNGTMIEGKPLQAKISNPRVAKSRDGATAEGREILVRKLPADACESELKEFFAVFGKVERVKFPKMKRPGSVMAYVVFDTKEAAEAAVQGANGKTLRDRVLAVEIAVDTRKPTQKSVLYVSPSPAPDGQNGAEKDGLKGADDKGGSFSKHSFIDRSIVLVHVPDIVKEARILALVQPYNPKKIEVYRKRASAIVEFSTVEDAGKAELALQGYEIIPGHMIEIGEKSQMSKMKAEHIERSSFVQPTAIRRPAPAPRGRRGGLGMAPRRVAGISNVNLEEAGPGRVARSNADFRAMFLMGQKEEEKEEKKKDENAMDL